MSHVYVMNADSRTTKLNRVHCRDEDKELQRLLELNLDLLPGDQIDPDEPRRWLLVKREMPVIDPSTGATRWSIDFFLCDQFGVPTLVECKRCEDSRSRREVVGQMLEYAANGHHYWSASEMRSYAETSHGGASELSAALARICEPVGQDAESFFNLVERNLRESKLRLIFFLEESPLELRSVVDFLNKQLKDTEVLLVEARQYEQGLGRVVVPWLFGFTEEARVAKRESRAETVGSSKDRGMEAFWKALSGSVRDNESLLAIQNLVDDARDTSGCVVSWIVSCIFQFPSSLPKRGLFGIRRSGALEPYFAYWNPVRYKDVSETQSAVRKKFASRLEEITGKKFSEKQQEGYPQISLVDGYLISTNWHF